METRRDSTSRYPYSSHISTYSPSVVPKSHSFLLDHPQRHSHPQLPRPAIHPDKIVDVMMRRDHARGYLYSRDPNCFMSCSPPQSMPLMVTANPRRGFYFSECEQLKGCRTLSESVREQRQHDREQPSRSVEWLLTRLPTQREPDTANMSCEVGSSGMLLLCSR